MGPAGQACNAAAPQTREHTAVTGPAHPPTDGTARTKSVREDDSLPEIRVVRGRPAPAELAAALIVIRTLAASRSAAPASGDGSTEDGEGRGGRGPRGGQFTRVDG
ncbi:acyl-CoA carboxylase epsilon subunit, partial [Streptomyces mirabilis]|uniref:acyl-CoA carboxylase epsilon subunit n=1 Tax=Streptomyces mirabilis TaxID=68239 RepID=UPI0036CB59E0